MGIQFTLKSPRIPWTVLAHTLLEFAKETDGGSMQNELQEAIFKVRRKTFVFVIVVNVITSASSYSQPFLIVSVILIQ